MLAKTGVLRWNPTASPLHTKGECNCCAPPGRHPRGPVLSDEHARDLVAGGVGDCNECINLTSFVADTYPGGKASDTNEHQIQRHHLDG